MKNLAYLLTLFWLTAAGCAGTPYLPRGEAPAAAPAPAPEDFWVASGEASTARESAALANEEIRPGTLLRLSNEADSELNGKFRVNRDGMLEGPHRVRLRGAGLTPRALSQALNQAYQSFFKGDPGLRVRVLRQQYWVSVQGMVPSSGDFLVEPFESVERTLARAGGAARDARYVQVARGEERFLLDLEAITQGSFGGRVPRWRGGEVLTVLSAAASRPHGASSGIELLGEVKSPGGLSFQEGADFYSYLVRAGGPTANADLDHVQVIRKLASGRAVTTGRAELVARHIELEPGDLVLVSADRPGEFNRNLQVGSVIASILSAIGIIILAL